MPSSELPSVLALARLYYFGCSAVESVLNRISQGLFQP